MTKKKKVENLLQIAIMSGTNYRSDDGRKMQRICYCCEELNVMFLANVQLPTEEYFEDANIVFIRDALRHFLER